MKKFALCVAIVLLTLAILAGCASVPEPGMVIDGKKISITLEENPTTGYTWNYTIGEGANGPAVEFVSDTYYEPKTELVGVGGVHTFVFQGIAEGTSEIEFVYSQAGSGDIAETRIPVVTVDASGTIVDAH